MRRERGRRLRDADVRVRRGLPCAGRRGGVAAGGGLRRRGDDLRPPRHVRRRAAPAARRGALRAALLRLRVRHRERGVRGRVRARLHRGGRRAAAIDGRLPGAAALPRREVVPHLHRHPGVRVRRLRAEEVPRVPGRRQGARRGPLRVRAPRGGRVQARLPRGLLWRHEEEGGLGLHAPLRDRRERRAKRRASWLSTLLRRIVRTSRVLSSKKSKLGSVKLHANRIIALPRRSRAARSRSSRTTSRRAPRARSPSGPSGY